MMGIDEHKVKLALSPLREQTSMRKSSEKSRGTRYILGGIWLGNVRTDQIKRTARELVRRFPDKFSTNFEENKVLVSQLLQGATTKVRNQIAGYIVRYLGGEKAETLEEETIEEEETQ
jgi:small subunit ribosomal protein S17e